MSVIARRFAIMTLILAIFAFSFSALVARNDRSLRVHLGTGAPCYHSATQGCVTLL